MKTKIAVLTATRAEYGLLSPIIHALMRCEEFDVRVVVTGAHLSKNYGYTYQEIEDDGVKIDEKIDILEDEDSKVAISKSMGMAMIKFGEYFSKKRPDALLVLGDRYETLAVACTAMNEQIPIIHLYGGETTEGAIDEAIRHSITKMSYLHLTSTEEYRKRVIQLGEHPNRVFTVGSIGVENALKKKLLSKEELEKSIDFKLNQDYAVVTFHPVTLENQQPGDQFEELLKALNNNKQMSYIFTKANADCGGQIINQMIDEYVKGHENATAFTSLGVLRYLSAVKYAKMVIGNSSSGIIEVPSFRIPTINIGDRQKGRIRAESVIDCDIKAEKIEKAMKTAVSDEFQKFCQTVKNPYGDGNSCEKIVSVIKQNFVGRTINLKKVFYDIE